MSYNGVPTAFTSLTVGGVPTMGMGGYLFTGNWYFCDYANGSDGNAGTADQPLKTITAAYTKCTEGNNDVVVIVSAPTTAAATTGTQRLTETLVWAKSATHLIGICAPTVIGQRARIAPLTTATTNINPLISVTAQGCLFANFSVFQGIGQSATDEQLINITGSRNAFINVAFQGMGHATGAGRAGSYVMKIDAGQENYFEGCQIGVDTVARTAANANVKFTNAAARNIFKNCVMPMYATANSPKFIDSNASGAIDRFNLFQGCLYNNAVNSGSGTAITSAVAFNASQGGTIIIDATSGGAIGVTDWTATDTATVKILGPVPNGDTSGMAVNADAT